MELKNEHFSQLLLLHKRGPPDLRLISEDGGQVAGHLDILGLFSPVLTKLLTQSTSDIGTDVAVSLPYSTFEIDLFYR